ncbi:MAG: site-2 protease family protein [Planctomycetes bacterium]|nr:site-2 protease family protein [Planctomycetota bacterium]
MFEWVVPTLQVVIGVSFIIFMHELGHFMVAKRAGVRVDAFSLGMGPVICCFRAGLGFRWGSAVREYETLQEEARRAPQTEREGIPRTDPHTITERARAMGQTEYRVSWIPIGGYVKMAGETVNDEHTGSPDELQSQSAGVRLAIFSAGSAMNLLIAIPLLTAAALLGITYTAPVIGDISAADSDEWDSELQVGDEILSVNGEPVVKLEDYHRAVVFNPNRTLRVRVRRGDEEREVEFITRGAEHYGLKGLTEPVVDEVIGGSAAERAGLKAGDRILSVGGAPTPTWDVLVARIQMETPKAVEARLPLWEKEIGELYERAKTEGKDLTAVEEVKPEPSDRPEDLLARFDAARRKRALLHELLDLNEEDDGLVEFEIERRSTEEPTAAAERLKFRLTPDVKSQSSLDLEPVVPARIFSVKGGSPARAAGVEKADVVSAVDGVPCRSLAEVRSRLKRMIGLPVKLSLLRGKEAVEVTLTPGRTLRGEAELGVHFAGFPLELADVPADTPFGKAGLTAGDVLVRALPPPKTGLSAWFGRVFGSEPPDFRTLDDLLRPGLFPVDPTGAYGPIVVEFKRGDALRQTTLRPDSILVPRAGLNMGKARLKSVRVKMGPGEACLFGLTKTWDNIVETFAMLEQLLSRAISPKNLAGPIGIFGISYKVAEEGLSKLLQLLALLTVNLGIVNMFPIPLLDGGHVFFLACEKVKGKPLSENALIVAQYVGLALLLTLVIFVTVQDVGRMF